MIDDIADNWPHDEIAELVAEVARLRDRNVGLEREARRLGDRAERAEAERDAYLRMLTPESSGGLWYAVTGRMDPFVVSWSAMELDGPWHDRTDAFAAVRKVADLDAAPAGEKGHLHE